MNDGDPIMDAPPNGTADINHRYALSKIQTMRDSLALVTLFLVIVSGALIGFWFGGTPLSALVGAATMLTLYAVARALIAKSNRKRDVAAFQAAHRVKAAQKEKEIEAARARGDFDRFGKQD